MPELRNADGSRKIEVNFTSFKEEQSCQEEMAQDLPAEVR
jgi:hypothetical protein